MNFSLNRGWWCTNNRLKDLVPSAMDMKVVSQYGKTWHWIQPNASEPTGLHDGDLKPLSQSMLNTPIVYGKKWKITSPPIHDHDSKEDIVEFVLHPRNHDTAGAVKQRVITIADFGHAMDVHFPQDPKWEVNYGLEAIELERETDTMVTTSPFGYDH